MNPAISRIRSFVAAGTFYPDDAGDLAATVDSLLAGANTASASAGLCGLIVPHAGYAYSGPVAATAYSLLSRTVPLPSRVVVLGPAHFVPLLGTAVPEAAAWATPFGAVPIDPELREAAASAGAAVDDGPHEPEHAAEVQLPFLRRILGPDLAALPVAVGDSDPEEVGRLIGVMAHLPGTLIVVSTDLSHYLDDATARAADGRTAEAIVKLDPRSVRERDACGVHALRGLLAHARRRRLAVSLLDLRTSADTAGSASRVVGYGAFAITF